MTKKPNILLVHGAWGDGSHWRHVIPTLHNKDYPVYAVQNPLTSLSDDVERTRKLAASLEGPTILVGHSYGGMVISQLGDLPHVVGLVFVAAFAPDKGESLGSIFQLRDLPSGAANLVPDPDGFLWIKRDKFHESFCHDLDKNEAIIMTAAQKPTSGRCFEDTSAEPAWKTKPSWYQMSNQDHMIPPETQQWFTERMKPKKTIRLDSSHASLASHPNEIIALIEDAAKGH